VVLALKDKWIWDFWFVEPKDADDGQWHVYFLQADKSLPDPHDRHRNVTQGHATSKDLVNWTHQGTGFAPSKTKAWDDWTTWTGSVVKDDTGLWHLFYTGTMRDLAGMHQRIGHATSKDMHSWQRVGKDGHDKGLILDLTGPTAEYYEEYTPGHWHDRAMRDPWVMKNPDGGWMMYFTARVPGRKEPNNGGAIGFATSPDLITWTLQKPVYDGGDFGQLEVPQVFKRGSKWYCAFCTSSTHWSQQYQVQNIMTKSPVTGTHYLMADHHMGPWKPAPGFLDGAMPPNRYSGKIVEHKGKLWLLGFLDHPDGKNFVGEVCDPVAISVDADGLLHLKG
jgi:beta-fructofuranosidase